MVLVNKVKGFRIKNLQTPRVLQFSENQPTQCSIVCNCYQIFEQSEYNNVKCLQKPIEINKEEKLHFIHTCICCFCSNTMNKNEGSLLRKYIFLCFTKKTFLHYSTTRITNYHFIHVFSYNKHVYFI